MVSVGSHNLLQVGSDMRKGSDIPSLGELLIKYLNNDGGERPLGVMGAFWCLS